MSADGRLRCGWGDWNDPPYLRYHDDEWGTPSRDDTHLFEMLVLEGAQAGLSWSTILGKRDGYRKAFKGFDVEKVARFNTRTVEKLMTDASIVRNRAKIESAVQNARATLDLVEEAGSLSAHLWSFVDDRPIKNRWKSLGELPSASDESRAMSKALLARGFRFVGPT